MPEDRERWDAVDRNLYGTIHRFIPSICSEIFLRRIASLPIFIVCLTKFLNGIHIHLYQRLNHPSPASNCYIQDHFPNLHTSRRIPPLRPSSSAIPSPPLSAWRRMGLWDPSQHSGDFSSRVPPAWVCGGFCGLPTLA